MTVTRGFALLLTVAAAGALVNASAPGGASLGGRIKTISARANGKGASLVIEATEPVAYVHAVAVRASARRQHLAHHLFDHFVQFARRHGCRHVKAITTPSNSGSIAFHKSLGMTLLGEPNTDGIPVVSDYAGRGASRVVFWKSI